MDIQEMKKLYADHLARAEGLLREGKIDEAQAEMGKADALWAQIELAQKLEEARKREAAPEAALTWRPAIGNEGEVPFDSKAWREVTVSTPVGEKKIRYYVPLAVERKGYASAFEAYLRRGLHLLGPNDRKTLLEGQDSAGGFLVPEEIIAELIKKMPAMAVIASLARIFRIGRDMAVLPRVRYTTDDRYTSPARIKWVGESPSGASAHRITDPTFGRLTIPVHVAMASAAVSRSLLEDAMFDVEGYLADILAEAFALGEEDAFINGDGIGKPKGLITSVGTGEDNIASVVSGNASALTGDGLISLYYAVPAQYRNSPSAAWVMNSSTMAAIEKLKDAQNRYLISSLIAGSLATPPFEAIKGKRVLMSEFMPDIAANAYPILFGDFTGYAIVERVGISIQRLDELYAEQDLVAIVGRHRVGGAVIEPWKLRAQKVSA